MATADTHHPQELPQAPDASTQQRNPVTSGDSVTNLSALLPLAQIVPSKTNPRKQFDGPEFDEMVLSIRRLGVIEPVLVRPVPMLMISVPDEVADRIGDHSGPLYELVCGERRYRAAKAAGEVDIPCVIRELTDEQAREIQIVENLHRKDIEPIEEAHGYVALLEEMRRNADPSYPRVKLVQEMAAKVGKSTRYIYARMQLAQAEPEVQQAVASGKIEASHADELVRHDAETQREYVKKLAEKPVSVKELRKSLRPKAPSAPATAVAKPATETLGGGPSPDINAECRAIAKLMRANIDQREEIVERITAFKVNNGSPFDDELRGFVEGLYLDYGALAACRNALPKPYGLHEQHFVNAQVSIERVVFELNREEEDGKKPNRDYMQKEAVQAILDLQRGVHILRSKIPVAESLSGEAPKKKVSSPSSPPGKASAAAAPKGHARPGVCRVCGCRPQHRCVLHFAKGKRKTAETCVVKDGVCTNPDCQKYVKLTAAKLSAVSSQPPAKTKAKAKKAAKKAGRK